MSVAPQRRARALPRRSGTARRRARSAHRTAPVAAAAVREGDVVRVTFSLEARRPRQFVKSFGEAEKEVRPNDYVPPHTSAANEGGPGADVLYPIDPPAPRDYPTGYEDRDPLKNPEVWQELATSESELEPGKRFTKPPDMYVPAIDQDYRQHMSQLPSITPALDDRGGYRFNDGKGVHAGETMEEQRALGQEEFEDVVKESGELTFQVGAGEIIQRNALLEVLDGVVRGYEVGETLQVECEGPKWTPDLCFEVPTDHPEIERLNGRYKSTGGVKQGEIVELANGQTAFVVQIYQEELESHGTARGPSGRLVEYRYGDDEEVTSREMVRLDCNSPYCDKDLTITVEIQGIEDPDAAAAEADAP